MLGLHAFLVILSSTSYGYIKMNEDGTIFTFPKRVAIRHMLGNFSTRTILI